MYPTSHILNTPLKKLINFWKKVLGPLTKQIVCPVGRKDGTSMDEHFLRPSNWSRLSLRSRKTEADYGNEANTSRYWDAEAGRDGAGKKTAEAEKVNGGRALVKTEDKAMAEDEKAKKKSNSKEEDKVEDEKAKANAAIEANSQAEDNSTAEEVKAKVIAATEASSKVEAEANPK
jgi:hypothetical protein